MVQEGKYIQIQYTGKFEDGEVFDSNVDGQPLEFQVGSGMIIPGLEKSVMGMNIDDEKDIVIEPADAYGNYDETRTHPLPIEEVKSSFDPEIGMQIIVDMADGQQFPAVIKEITDQEVIIDLNHPLAGQTLHFSIKILAVNDEPQLEQGGCGCDDSGCDC